MEWLIIVFYVIGFAFGIYLGKTLGYDKFYDDVYVRMRRYLDERISDLESRLSDDAFETSRHRDVASGNLDAYMEMMDYLYEGLWIEHKN